MANPSEEDGHGRNSLVYLPERAPRLRRLARFIDEQADRSTNPPKAHALACRMRLRAAEREAGSASEEEASIRLIAALADESDERAIADFLRTQLPRKIP